MPNPFEKITIVDTKTQNPTTKTLFFDKQFNAKPGQFVMLWLPGTGERPFSISHGNGITIQARGPVSTAISGLKKGDFLFYRGPFGKPFQLKGKRICLVGGGCGCAPLLLLAKEARQKDLDVTAIIAGRSKDQLMLQTEFDSLGCTVKIATDDGSAGFKGNAVQLFSSLNEKFECVYACGPEIMMKALAEACKNKAECQVSLERKMKCGIGICGECHANKLRVCRDGPVFDSAVLLP